MGTISSIFSMIALQANSTSAASPAAASSAGGSSGSGTSVFGEAVNVSLFTESLAVASTGQIVEENIIGASYSAVGYAANGAGGYTETGFAGYIGNLDIPVIVDGKPVAGCSSGSGSSTGTAMDEMNNILKNLENNIQTAIDKQPQWQQWKAEDLLMGSVTEFSAAKS